jgi:hypothetical protein
MTTNLQAILTPLLDENGDILFSDDFDPEFHQYDNPGERALKTSLQTNDITVQHIEQHGGEGEGEDYYNVWQFTRGKETVFVKFHGSYYSYDGSTYSGYFFATPVERTVTFYEPA